MTAHKIEVTFEEGLRLAAGAFAPIFNCTPEEFYDLMIDLNHKGLLNEKVKSSFCHLYEFEESDIKETITLKEALER